MYRHRLTGSFAALIALAALGACTVIGHERVTGWPALQTREHYVPQQVMRDKCSKHVGFGMSPLACAEINLYAGTCDIWFSADFPPGDSIIEHERLHCQGYDHIGGNLLKRAHAEWQNRRSQLLHAEQ